MSTSSVITSICVGLVIFVAVTGIIVVMIRHGYIKLKRVCKGLYGSIRRSITGEPKPTDLELGLAYDSSATSVTSPSVAGTPPPPPPPPASTPIQLASRAGQAWNQLSMPESQRVRKPPPAYGSMAMAQGRHIHTTSEERVAALWEQMGFQDIDVGSRYPDPFNRPYHAAPQTDYRRVDQWRHQVPSAPSHGISIPLNTMSRPDRY